MVRLASSSEYGDVSVGGSRLRSWRWCVHQRGLQLTPPAAVNSQGQGTQFTGANQDLHHDLGLALFILIGVQGVL
jgi:hypothetical protein